MKEVVKAQTTELRVLQEGVQGVAEIMRENIGTGGMSEFDLDRVKIPAGGGVAWQVNTLEGPDSVKELVGVVVAFRDVRTYWKEKFGSGGGNVPPDCTSHDSLTGVGTPGGSCLTCPLAQFGSDEKRQACRQGRQLFILRGDGLLPDVVALPPTSLKSGRQFFLRLTSQKIPFYGVEMRIGLEVAKNGGGIAYSKATFGLVRRLNDEQTAQMAQYQRMIQPLIDRTAIDTEAQKEGDTVTGL